ncbi:Gp49 family protein [Paenibacillus sp. GCM10023252]|uniref:Gp49 family protein n=1 Tax=Paenibacillus sp. GCM10023252 TaxID=3252649 RepID=UPI0036182895
MNKTDGQNPSQTPNATSTNQTQNRRLHETDTRRELEALIESKEFMVMGKRTTICLLSLHNGIEVVGKSRLIDYAHFNKDIGEYYAFEDALNELRKIAGMIEILESRRPKNTI